MTAAIKSSVARDTIVLERTYRATPDRVFVLAPDGSNVLEGYIGGWNPALDNIAAELEQVA